MASSQQTVTTDHDEIRRWAEEHGGRPARVRGTGTGSGDDPGILRIDFPGGAGEQDLEPISWEEWFEKFDEQGLAAVIQDRKADGDDSTFVKLVKR
jgi:alkylation response protein AidB-like acyl-CoA dehydrogenase